MSSKDLDSKAVAGIIRLRYARADAAAKRTHPDASMTPGVSDLEHHEAVGMRRAVRDIAIEIAEHLPTDERDAFLDSCRIDYVR